jgi:DNA-binding IclR family transcriptional regulator
MSATDAWYATRTMQALEVLAFRPCSASQVADAIGVHPRTARRLLARLVADGYVSRIDGDYRRYSPTMRLVALAAQVLERNEVGREGAQYVKQLHDRTGETSHLTMPSYQSAVCVIHRSASEGEHVQCHLRELVPVHASAAGKALLAYRDRWRDDVFSRPLERFTERTLTEADAFRPEVNRIRFRGYAIEDEEYRHGQRAAAAPIFDSTGQAIAALGVSGAAERLSIETCRAFGKAAMELAAELTVELGSTLPAPLSLVAANG